MTRRKPGPVRNLAAVRRQQVSVGLAPADLAAPDPVLTLVAVYGLRDPRTVEALVAALEVWT